jgi:hypothetical protein
MGMDAKSTRWGSCIASEASQAATYSVGLMSASRFANDRRAVDRLLRSATQELTQLDFGATTLFVCLDVLNNLQTKTRTSTAVPSPSKSLLGPWYEVFLPASDTKSMKLLTDNLAVWLPQWKQEHRLVVVDLGPMHLTAAQSAGRLCDVCYLILGPGTCASHDWIVRQVNQLDRMGTVIAGSVIATAAA